VKLLGIDIGTTTICGLLLEAATGEIVSVISRPNPAALPGKAAWESLQDPAVILREASRIIDGLLDAHRDVGAIGVAGQMHGVLYVDKAGRAVSPLYTWQDGRGDLPDDGGVSTATRLSSDLGQRVSTGMGFVTHAWNTAHGLVPREASTLCTIPDFLAMTAARASSPLMDPTNAAALGCFDLDRLDFRRADMDRLGMGGSLFPPVARSYPALGEARPGVPVFVAAGDNQASFLGSVRETLSTLLLNIGTGSQVSVRVESSADVPGMDVRPFPFGGYLAVGAALCGGRAYALLKDFFEKTLRLFTGEEREARWEMMNSVRRQDLPGASLQVDARFSGTRQDPALRGTISSIGLDNFTPEHLIAGMREGIASELLGFYDCLPGTRRSAVSALVGSGNAIRMNPALRAVFEERLRMRMRVPAHREETSFGAALLAGVACGALKDLEQAGRMVRYET
jgi:sedoheptulokinase